jgi:hypothetical protein
MKRNADAGIFPVVVPRQNVTGGMDMQVFGGMSKLEIMSALIFAGSLSSADQISPADAVECACRLLDAIDEKRKAMLE